MTFDEDTHHRIQQYLNNAFNPEERKRFEEELRANQALAQEVDFQSDLQGMLADTPENQLRKNLQKLNQQVRDTDPPKQSWKYLLWLIPLLLIGAWWWSNSQALTHDAIEINPAVETSTTKEPSDLKINSSPPEEVEVPPPVDSKSSEEERKENQTPAPQQPKQKRPPIAADFTPILELDFLIRNPTRSSGLRIEIERKPTDVQLQSSNEVTHFRFSGTITSADELPDSSIKFYLFSNDKTAIRDFQPIWSELLSMDHSSDKRYQFDVSKKIQLPPGLYYYLLEKVDGEDVFFVEKFTVR